MDDHKYWAKDEDDEKQSEMNQRWQDISEKNADRYGNFFERSSIKYRAFSGSGPGLRTDSDMTTRSFLHKFAVLKEGRGYRG